jgi:transposase
LNDWRDAARAGRLGPASSAGFIPAVIVPEVTATTSPPPVDGSRIEIVTSNGRRIVVDGRVDVDALLRIVRGLETLR